MTGQMIVERAAVLSGRPTEAFPWGDGLQHSALAFVDTVTAELWYALETTPYTPLETLESEIPLPCEAALALAYGVAMLFARAEGDLTAHTLLASEYDRHRAVLCRSAPVIRDRFGEVTRCDI